MIVTAGFATGAVSADGAAAMDLGEGLMDFGDAIKVAAGDFSNPIHADSDDELGQLAATFDDMQRQLARLDTARKQFIASASHELRTPIFSLGGFLELLADEDLDEDTRRQFLDQLVAARRPHPHYRRRGGPTNVGAWSTSS